MKIASASSCKSMHSVPQHSLSIRLQTRIPILNTYACNMELFETMAMKKADLKPTVWCRYVDDTFVMWPHGHSSLDGFLVHLNSQTSTIPFTMETETDDTLPLLNVQVHREGKKLTTSVYRKSTHTDLYGPK